MGSAGGEVHPVGVSAHLRRRVSVEELTVAELPLVAVSPTPQSVVDTRGAGMKPASADLGPILVHTDLSRCISAMGIPRPELPIVVVSPAPQGTVSTNPTGVLGPGADLAPQRSRGRRDRASSAHCPRGRRTQRGPGKPGHAYEKR